ncbi:hypothetical protein GH714_018500 [Hevea brasiliensis]|uniref:Nucleotide-sugar transporter family protein n=2 Tax=Hevea brasiliensis TaxID=3981 RepID=A0A6A6K5T4_HEVBR|nr:hypothetical protein GH714_018500 [Hevea brasiliensis]
MAATKRKGTNSDSDGMNARREVIVTTSVLTCEIAKVICALILMAKNGSLKKLSNEWTLVGSLTASGLPAAIYAVQNSLLQISYKNLDSLTFSMLNQTKIFFTALFTFIILRQKQSIQQIGALFLLIMAAVLLSVGEGSSKGSSSSNPDQILFYGIVPVLVASVLSGLASALCQWASQVKKHSSYLMTVEMSIVGSLCLLVSTTKSPDGEAIRRYGFFHGWTPLTMIPVIANSLGGILVGLVTSHAGGVRKMGSRLGRRVVHFANLPIKLLMPTSFNYIKEIALKTIPSASKIEIKRVLESLYGFEVDKVRTLNMEGKKKKIRGLLIAKPDYKKAYVTLRNPLSISPDLFPLRVIEEEKERKNKQRRSSIMEDGEGKKHWLDGKKEERLGYEKGTGRGRGGVRDSTVEKAKFPWSSMRSPR